MTSDQHPDAPDDAADPGDAPDAGAAPGGEPTTADLLADAGSNPQPGHPASSVPTGESAGEHLSTGTDTVEGTEAGATGADDDRSAPG
jgi:hypothetical protein